MPAAERQLCQRCPSEEELLCRNHSLLAACVFFHGGVVQAKRDRRLLQQTTALGQTPWT